MEYILMSLFGGGICDWQDIGQTNYSWSDIFETAKDIDCTDYIENLSINSLYYAICYMGVSELLDCIEEYCDSANTKEEIILAKQLKNTSIEDFDIYVNCLDTYINYIGENREIISQLFSDKIDEINDKICFTCINMQQ